MLQPIHAATSAAVGSTLRELTLCTVGAAWTHLLLVARRHFVAVAANTTAAGAAAAVSPSAAGASVAAAAASPVAAAEAAAAAAAAVAGGLAAVCALATVQGVEHALQLDWTDRLCAKAREAASWATGKLKRLIDGWLWRPLIRFATTLRLGGEWLVARVDWIVTELLFGKCVLVPLQLSYRTVAKVETFAVNVVLIPMVRAALDGLQWLVKWAVVPMLRHARNAGRYTRDQLLRPAWRLGCRLGRWCWEVTCAGCRLGRDRLLIPCWRAACTAGALARDRVLAPGWRFVRDRLLIPAWRLAVRTATKLFRVATSNTAFALFTLGCSLEFGASLADELQRGGGGGWSWWRLAAFGGAAYSLFPASAALFGRGLRDINLFGPQPTAAWLDRLGWRIERLASFWFVHMDLGTVDLVCDALELLWRALCAVGRVGRRVGHNVWLVFREGLLGVWRIVRHVARIVRRALAVVFDFVGEIFKTVWDNPVLGLLFSAAFAYGLYTCQRAIDQLLGAAFELGWSVLWATVAAVKGPLRVGLEWAALVAGHVARLVGVARGYYVIANSSVEATVIAYALDPRSALRSALVATTCGGVHLVCARFLLGSWAPKLGTLLDYEGASEASDRSVGAVVYTAQGTSLLLMGPVVVLAGVNQLGGAALLNIPYLWSTATVIYLWCAYLLLLPFFPTPRPRGWGGFRAQFS
jgi:hypothetical protein